DPARGMQVTLTSSPGQKDPATYKQGVISGQGFRGDPADFVRERSQTLNGREWTVLEFRNSHRRPAESEIHYFLPVGDAYLTAFVTGDEAEMPKHQDSIESFLRQVQVK